MKNSDQKRKCVFCDIINKKEMSIILFENEDFILINDIKPDATIHLLAIPKKHFTDMFDANVNDLETIKMMLFFIKENASHLGLSNGYRIVINNGQNATQTIKHFHIHILGGQQLKHMEKNY